MKKRRILMMIAICRKEKEQGHVEQIDKIVQISRATGMAHDHQNNAKGLRYRHLGIMPTTYRGVFDSSTHLMI